MEAAPKQLGLLTCALCCDTYRKPKILPCFHTYCEDCLVTLARHHKGNKFPCPTCRRQIIVPRGGVSHFQSNFYIDGEQLEKIQRKTVCKDHPNNEVASFCVSCDQAICVECMLTYHRPHDIQTIPKMAVTSREQLAADKVRVQEVLEKIHERKNRAHQSQTFFKTKVEELTSQIKARCDTIFSEARKHCDAQLEILNSLTRSLDGQKNDAEMMSTLTRNGTTLTVLLGEIEKTLQLDIDMKAVMLAEDVRKVRGTPNVLSSMLIDNWPPEDLGDVSLMLGQPPVDIACLLSGVIGNVKRCKTSSD